MWTSIEGLVNDRAQVLDARDQCQGVGVFQPYLFLCRPQPIREVHCFQTLFRNEADLLILLAGHGLEVGAPSRVDFTGKP